MTSAASLVSAEAKRRGGPQYTVTSRSLHEPTKAQTAGGYTHLSTTLELTRK